MRVLEHRRHSLREAVGGHLSPAGRELARRVGATIGPFDRVVSSPVPRAVETVEALGFRVDAQRAELGPLPEEVSARVDVARPRSFGAYVTLVGASEVVGGFARSQATLWREELERLPDGGRLLMVSHGGLIELGVAAAAPIPAGTWGAPLAPLDGVLLAEIAGRWSRAEVVRAAYLRGSRVTQGASEGGA